MSIERVSGDEDDIEVLRHPLAELDAPIARCRDSTTVIGLQWLLAHR